MKVIKLLIPVLVVLFVEAYILISLPNNSNASTNPTNSGGCGGWVQVSTSEFGTCGTSSYGATYTINNTSGKDISVHYNTESWYCQNPSPHMDGAGRLSCREGSPQTSANIRFIPAGGSAGVSIGGFTTQPTMTCGSQQTDFSFKVYHAGVNVCNYGSPSVTDGWSFCTTGQSCNAPTAVPTAIPTTVPPTSVPPTAVPPTAIPTAVPTEMPQPTEVPVQPTAVPTTQQVINNTSTVCNGVTQVGQVNNANCQTQTQSQQQNNNQNVVVNVASAQVQPTPTPEEVVQQPQQEVLSATVAPSVVPSQMPSTGAGAQTLLLLGSLIPVGLKLKNLV